MPESEIKVLKCGCCFKGCVCWEHQDAAHGLPQQRCPAHSAAGKKCEICLSKGAPAGRRTCGEAACMSELLKREKSKKEAKR